MITLIHGEDTTTSRNYYIALKQKKEGAITLDGSTMLLSDIVQALGGDSLFVLEKNIFIEDFFSKRKKSREMESILKYLVLNQEFASIYLWETKDLTPKQISSLEKATVKHFKPSQTIFQFLDSIKPKNTSLMISLFHKTLEHEDEQFIFFMLIKQIRILLALSDTTQKETIDEIKRLSPWQSAKLQKQVKLFTIEKLRILYKKLFEIESAMKTGKLAGPLNQTIDFLLLEV